MFLEISNPTPSISSQQNAGTPQTLNPNASFATSSGNQQDNLSLFAMNQNWMISYIKNDFQSLRDNFTYNSHRRLLSPINSKLKELNFVGLEKQQIFSRIRFLTQIYDGSQIESVEKAKVEGLGEARSEDALSDH